MIKEMNRESSGDVIKELGEVLDRIMTLDIPARGVIGQLYQAARDAQGDEPLTFLAASKLYEVAREGGTVVIACGAKAPFWPVTEVDGPLGAAALARSLVVACNAKVFLVSEKLNQEVLTAVVRAVGVNAAKEEDLELLSPAVCIDTLDVKDMEDPKLEEYIEKRKPSAMIGVERLSANRKGIYHSMRGLDFSEGVSRIDHLFTLANAKEILTVGIGDGGNEVGFGLIEDAVRSNIPNADSCQCPCKAGMAAHVSTDILVTATVSNWGAYAVADCLAMMAGEPDALYSPDLEMRAIEWAVREGALDASGAPILAVDLLTDKANASMVRIMKDSVHWAEKRGYKP